jgi:DNA-binding SARP family transcriptional activator
MAAATDQRAGFRESSAGYSRARAHRGAPSIERRAFDALPHGLLVLDAHGRVVCANEAATRLVGARSAAELRCCALLGCGARDTELDGVCLTELALSGERVLAGIRVGVDAQTGAAAMWVTAAPIGGENARVVVQLHPSSSEHRRRHAASNVLGGPRLRITTLGPAALESAGAPLGGSWLDQRSGQLLKYLVAARRRAVTVEEIGESIWPHADYAASASVRYYVHTLRRLLEPERGSRARSAFVVSRGGAYRLDLSNVAIDADEFEARMNAGLRVARHDPRRGASEIDDALSLYRGDFLADLPYAEWTLAERNSLHDLACTGLHRLADIRVELQDVNRAVSALERLASLQPLDEDVHRRLMELDIARGRRSDAVRRYATLCHRLRRAFGRDPRFTPADLMLALA